MKRRHRSPMIIDVADFMVCENGMVGWAQEQRVANFDPISVALWKLAEEVIQSRQELWRFNPLPLKFENEWSSVLGKDLSVWREDRILKQAGI
jgi:hypothetical protein